MLTAIQIPRIKMIWTCSLPGRTNKLERLVLQICGPRNSCDSFVVVPPADCRAFLRLMPLSCARGGPRGLAWADRTRRFDRNAKYCLVQIGLASRERASTSAQRLRTNTIGDVGMHVIIGGKST